MTTFTIDLSPILQQSGVAHPVLTDAQFEQLCAANPEIKFERTPTGELVIMSPTGGETGKNNVEIAADFVIWNRRTKLGVVFDSSTCFRLPQGGDRSPDVAWVEQSRWDALTLEQQRRFPPLCPDFVLELLSPSDNLSTIQAKMQEYLNNGLRLGWLLNPQDQQVEIYRPEQAVEILQAPETLSGEPILPGFIVGSDRLRGVHGVKQFSRGRTVRESLPPDLAELRMHHIQQALTTGELQVYEQRITIDGQPQEEEVRILVMGDDEVLIMVRDITDRKRAEEALRIAEENYRSIFENALEGIFQSSPGGQFINANPALAKIYGYNSPAEMMASITNIGEQLYVDPEKRAEFRELLEKQDAVKDFQYRCYCKDGSIIWIQIDARAVKDSDDKVLYYEGIVQDITERKRREDELRRQLEELKIEIDQKKREKEVATLTGSSYFQEVQQEIAEVNLDEFWS
ncbi:Uma2 family endonuclease [Leptolyngbya sp. 7M]|uniref:Uma2 family endonuclease n=1 Tax=Leptolyngbya sp. 7M TaxID=2812896 RepID=UPI00293930AF|nr:Uma2 family endonuclease [Leptolyngbya sp. 7M]